MYNQLKKLLLSTITIGLVVTTQAQISKSKVNSALSKIQSVKNTKTIPAKITNTDAISALKDMLQTGTKNASSKLSATDGYFGNLALKILLPPEASKVENTMRRLGFGQLADNTILNMNRAAEAAAGQAVPIFIDAIKTMSIEDGLTIVNGGNNAATNFLKAKTTVALTNAFRPVIEQSLNKYNVATYWNQLFSVYNKLPTTMNPINPDLTGYVAERALSGLFTTISQEENKIRTDPAAQVSSLLQKVFGKK